MSGNLLKSLPFQENTQSLNQDQYVKYSFCLGSFDWATFLVPTNLNNEKSMS